MMAIIRTKLFIYLSVIIFFSQGYSHGFLFLESPLFGLRHNVFSTKSAKWHRTYGNPVLQTRHLLANFDEGSSSSSSSSSNAPKAGTRKILNWNLQELLSHPPMGMSDPRLIHLMDVYNAATSKLKEPTKSLDYTGRLSTELLPFRRFVRRYNHDMGHDGRFSVFVGEDENGNKEEGTLQSDVVFSMENPLAYIRDTLSYGRCDCNNTFSYGSHADREAVVFAPGLHTCYEQSRNDVTNSNSIQQRTSTQRLKFYSEVLDNLPMAQIQTGTFVDRGDVDIELSVDTVAALKSFGLLIDSKSFKGEGHYESITTADRKNQYCIRAKDLDIVRAVLSSASEAPFSLPNRINEDDENLKRTLIKLINIAVESVQQTELSSTPHLVLITYSATSHIFAAAISAWKHSATNTAAVNTRGRENYGPTKEVLSEERAEDLLRKALTVVTIGGLSKAWQDGPAYIHISMYDDLLASSLGVSDKSPTGGGKDAVYLRACSPYALPQAKQPNFDSNNVTDDGIYVNDAHNMDACGIQFLALILRIYGMTSFRDLYGLARDEINQLMKMDMNPTLFALNYAMVGQLQLPPQLDDELLPSMIRATGGDRWLWNPKYQLGKDGVDGKNSHLPSLLYSEALLTDEFGYNVFDEIVETCTK